MQNESKILRNILIYIYKCWNHGLTVQIGQSFKRPVLKMEKEVKATDEISLKEVIDDFKEIEQVFSSEKHSMAWSIYEEGALIWFEKELEDFIKPYIFANRNDIDELYELFK